MNSDHVQPEKHDDERLVIESEKTRESFKVWRVWKPRYFESGKKKEAKGGDCRIDLEEKKGEVVVRCSPSGLGRRVRCPP